MYNTLKPLIFLLPEEFAHRLAIIFLRIYGFFHYHGLIRRPMWAKDYSLTIQTPFGKLDSPLGLAAGCDKNAQALFGWQALGFGFVEVGTLTPKAQPGNPKPRLFRFPRLTALVNRLGFNNHGVEAAAERIKKAKQKGLLIKVGGNIGKNFSTPLISAAQDYRLAALALSPHVDYLVINVSSPNTPGLRVMQNSEFLEQIILAVKSVSANTPLFIKVAPDEYLNFIKGICELVRKHNLSGVICGNTLANHASSGELSEADIIKLPQGGLSGKPVFKTNLALAHAYSLALVDKFIIGVGGIVSAGDASEYFKAGVKAVQIYTGLVYSGPSLIKSILCSLIKK